MKTHPLNVSYLVVGLAFLGIAGSWALSAADVVDAGDVGWMIPLSLVAAGAIGLVAFIARGTRRSRNRQEVPSAFDEPAYDVRPWSGEAVPGYDDVTARPDATDTDTDTETAEDTTVLPTHEEKP